MQKQQSPEPSQSGRNSDELTKMQLLGRIERLAHMLGEAEAYLIELVNNESIDLPDNYSWVLSDFIDRVDQYFDGDY